MTSSRAEPLVILGVETSCDDTAAAVLRGTEILASIVSSQDEVHSPYGGVVPELASRHHMQNILPIIDQALHTAGMQLGQLDGIAVTCGPGLVGSLLVGVSVAKALAMAKGLPFIGVISAPISRSIAMLVSTPAVAKRKRRCASRAFAT